MVRAGGILVTASRKKNFHVRKFKIATGQLSIEEVEDGTLYTRTLNLLDPGLPEPIRCVTYPISCAVFSTS